MSEEKETNEEEYLKAINIFFSLKSSYEEKKRKEKNNIKKKAVNQADYVNQIKNYKPKCVNCKSFGGTIFNITSGYYTAECNAENKCNLNIKIKRGVYTNTETYSQSIRKNMNEIKTNIIKNKLNLIFKLDNEDVIVNEFDTLKNEFKVNSEKNKLINMYDEKLSKVLWADYEDFYEAEKKDPEDDNGEKKGNINKEKIKRDLKILSVKKDDLQKIIERKIDQDIRTFKEYLSEYNNDKVKNKAKLRTALSLYIENIRPSVNKLFNLKYEEFIMEENNIGGGGFGKKPDVEYVFKLKKKSAENSELKLENFAIQNLYFNQKIVQRTIKSMARSRKNKVKGKRGMTITFSNSVENHFGMKQHGNIVPGYTINDLRRAILFIKKLYPDSAGDVSLINLVDALPEEERKDAEPAAVLVWKGGVNKILSAINKTSIDLFKEHDDLEKDTTYYDTRRSKVLNKKARHNLCFAEEAIAPNIAEKQGTVVAFNSVPLTKYIREALPQILGDKAKDKNAEGNYYYDLNKTGIGFHGDAERKDVIGVRSGEDDTAGFPIHFQWFYKSEPIGERVEIDLTNSDIYVMSEKAVGTDWKRRNVKTLRHAAGGKDTKYLKISRKVSPIREEKGEEKQQKTIASMFKSVSSKDQNVVSRPDLYNSTDVFKFYSKSKDDIPGKGKAGGGENVKDPTIYEELASIPNWRRVLSNMYVKKDADGTVLPLFKLDGYSWASVEHWYHANKYKYKFNDEKYKQFYEGFTYESNSQYSRDPFKALSVGGKRGTLNKKKFRPATIVMDPNYEEIKEKVMKDGQRAKYTQDVLCKKVLLETKKAKLVHIVLRRSKPTLEIPFISTMEIRESLQSNIEINLEEEMGELKQVDTSKKDGEDEEVAEGDNKEAGVEEDGGLKLQDFGE